MNTACFESLLPCMSCACALAAVELAFSSGVCVASGAYEWSSLFAGRMFVMSLGSFKCWSSIGTVDARLAAREAQVEAGGREGVRLDHLVRVDAHHHRPLFETELSRKGVRQHRRASGVELKQQRQHPSWAFLFHTPGTLDAPIPAPVMIPEGRGRRFVW